jgi:alpha/beta superfamily hydrolase
VADVGERGYLDAGDGVRLEYATGPVPATPTGAAVICHPHPLQGGDMDNPVVMAIARASRDSGLVPLRFNFRGAGRSGGAHGGGVAEVRDVEVAVARARALAPGSLVVAGYSFGAGVVGRWLGQGDVVDAVVLVAPSPVPEGLEEGVVPVLVVVGGLDTISPAREVERVAAERGWSAVVLPGEDHFLWSGLGEVEDAVRQYLVS